jgi:myosin-5
LLQLDASEMRSWLCHQKIGSMRKVFFKPMIVDEAVGARDALAKHIYAQLFNWIVTVMNSFMKSSQTYQRFIGVLDIYGFETFDINTFEQLCINYANEKLLQDFNQNKLVRKLF